MSLNRAALRRAVEAWSEVCRVVVAETKGSTPREVGAEMLVWRGGQSGTIGGGRLEFDAAKLAVKNLDREIPWSSKSFALGSTLGQCCGGAVTLSFETFTVDTVPEGPTHARPLQASNRMPEAVRKALEMRISAPRILDGWFLEPVDEERQALWIYGAGHVGSALVEVLAPLPDFAITWVDTAPERFPDTVPEGVATLPADPPMRVLRHASPAAHHLILTYSHEMDLELCHGVLSQPFQSCGLIGSATKWARFRKRLGDLGHEDAQISRIRCPIGDPSLGKHPQAIAVGVAARLLDGQMLKDSANLLGKIPQ